MSKRIFFLIFVVDTLTNAEFVGGFYRTVYFGVCVGLLGFLVLLCVICITKITDFIMFNL